MVRRHFPDVWGFLRRLGFAAHVADDAAQELFFVAARRLEEVQPGRERAFLFGAALRIAKGLKRKGAREVLTPPLDADLDVPSAAGTPEDMLDDEQARALVYRLLAELDEDQRAVFVMFEIEEMTMKEIAEMLGAPMGTVASRLRRGREDFRARLERYRKSQRGTP
ncbi:hypothetical protein AKJ09_02015 [Labilithrix luteola]|uniref:RNA polymerase sigma factor RpoE n=2 Tax=Labilithrix luteola TaxID=1391654 RepID=A0A0K1PPP5_9BACT|nr:hypothetical protein AKJ09_02015 [Labilithrix luteola]